MRRTWRAGFTLIELLVVIGIVALLFSTLFPGLTREVGTQTILKPRFSLAPNPDGDPLFVDPPDAQAPALPPAPGNFTEFSWRLSTQGEPQTPSDSVDFGPGIGESRVVANIGSDPDELFRGTVRFENVNGDLVIQSTSSAAFLRLDLIDQGIQLYNEDSFSTQGSLTIPSAQITGMSILDVLPQVIPLLIQTPPGTNAPYFRSDTDEQFGNLISLSAGAQTVPEPGSAAVWLALAIGGCVVWLCARKQSARTG
jgi:prepilin-type N-terminal cleavage/methylation domain-containing protein